MKLRLNTIPRAWNGEPLHYTKTDEGEQGKEIPRSLRSYLQEALFSAHVAGYNPQTGQPIPESSANLLKRSRLHGKLEKDEVVLLDDEEFKLLQDCVAAHYLDVASVPITGCIHASLEAEKTDEKSEGSSEA